MARLSLFRRRNAASHLTLLRRIPALHRILSDRPSSLRHDLSTCPHSGSASPPGFSTAIAGGQALGRMRAVGLALLFLLVPAGMLTAGTGLWKQLSVPTPAGKKYAFIDFADSCNGWVMSTDGFYSMTQDGGRTWSQPRGIPDPDQVESMKLYGRDSAAVVTHGSPVWSRAHKLYHTSNGGQTWFGGILPDSIGAGTAISLVNKSLIGFVSMAGMLYTSTNMGGTWHADSLTWGNPFGSELGILSHDRMFIGGGGGLAGSGFLYTSTDGGTTWTSAVTISQFLGSNGHYMSTTLCFFWLYHGDEAVFVNSVAFNATRSPGFQSIGAEAMGALFNDGSCFSFERESRMTKRSADPADSSYAIDQYAATGNHIKAVSLLSPECSWALDDSGMVYQRVDLLNPVSEEEPVPERLQLLQNYPNPFNAHTTIRYTLPSSGSVDLRIVDVLGREVMRLVENQSAGSKNVSLDMSVCVSGIYYCSLRFNGTVRTVKMALIR
jgi:hypothetical protein